MIGPRAVVDLSVTASPNLLAGVRSLTTFTSILILEVLWLGLFLYLGRSSVTAARVSFHVIRERV